MKDSGTSLITDKASLVALIAGSAIGLSVALWRRFIVSIPGFLAGTQLQLVLVLALSVLAALVTVILARKQFTSRFHAPGEAGRLGIQAGVFCTLWAGAVLTAMATWDASGASTAAMDRALRSRMWLVCAVSVASLLPSVLCGFVGGLFGGQVALQNWETAPSDEVPATFPWLRWVKVAVTGLAVLLLASPASFLGRALVVDPPPVVAAPSIAPAPPAPPPFRYDPPQGIKSAKIGEIQPDFTKVIPQVQRDCPVALSPDDVMLAFGDATGSQPAITIFDLHRFTKTASIPVPSFPHGNLSWSPDQKSIACTIGEGKSRRVWIVRIGESKAIELPRPPGRDVPGGDLHWWRDGELAFFPTDEAPLAFDLDKLVLLPFEDSAAYKKLDDITKRLWKEGPRDTWPGQVHWKLGIRTLITSAVPPSRREPDGPWQLSGQSVCAFTHPSLPLAFGLKSLGVAEIIHRAAAEFIHDRHRLGAFVGGLLRDAHAAEDVIQEVWVRLAAEIEKGTAIENQPAWCRGVARNLILKHWRKQQTTKVVADSEVMEAFLAQVETAFSEVDQDADDEWQRRQQALDDCVATLQEKSRRMLSLRYEGRQSVEEVAKATGQTFDAVTKALYRLRQALTECVEHKLSQTI